MLLQNERIRIEIAELGAELMSIYDRKNQTELLFNGDPAYWKRRSPVLFPNVGKAFGGSMLINGQRYPAAQHGFARDSLFALEESSDRHAVYLLASSAATLEKYPFPFELRIGYFLEENELKVRWTVKNTGECGMFFTIGGHPAFCFDTPTDRKQDYQLHFPGKDALEYVLLDPALGAVRPDLPHALPLENGCLKLSEALFANDALIFDGGQIEEVWLCKADGSRRIGMVCKDFPNFGVWSVRNAPFVCLEPWAGRADDCGFEGELREKPNVNAVAPGMTFEKEYTIVLP